MTGAVWLGRLLVCLSHMLTEVTGRGATMASSYDSSNVFVPNPEDPIPISGNFTPPARPNRTLMEYTDLGYYGKYYDKYASFSASADRPIWDADRGVCFNYALGENDTYLGAFSCPLPFEPDAFTACCGFDNVEFCCLSEDFMTDRSYWLTVTDWMFILILLGFLILGPLLWMCCGANWSLQEIAEHLDCCKTHAQTKENIYETAVLDRKPSRSTFDYKLYIGDTNKELTVSEVEELAICNSISETSAGSNGSKQELVET